MQVTKEIWKDIPSFEGLYQVSNLGNVKSIRFKRFLHPGKGSNGYLRVTLSCGKEKQYGVHKLVAMAFLNHVPNGLKTVVHHIDNDQLNNRVDNLMIVTNRENTSKKIGKKQGKYSSTFTGVYWNKRDKRWDASIRINGKVTRLGHYLTEIEASKAYENRLFEIGG